MEKNFKVEKSLLIGRSQLPNKIAMIKNSQPRILIRSHNLNNQLTGPVRRIRHWEDDSNPQEYEQNSVTSKLDTPTSLVLDNTLTPSG